MFITLHNNLLYWELYRGKAKLTFIFVVYYWRFKSYIIRGTLMWLLSLTLLFYDNLFSFHVVSEAKCRLKVIVWTCCAILFRFLIRLTSTIEITGLMEFIVPQILILELRVIRILITDKVVEAVLVLRLSIIVVIMISYLKFVNFIFLHGWCFVLAKPHLIIFIRNAYISLLRLLTYSCYLPHPRCAASAHIAIPCDKDADYCWLLFHFP